MTYLELINNVLRRLREDTVVSVTENEYAIMAGDFVNDAKRIVEDSYQWEALRQEYIFNTVDGTDTYTLTNLSNRSKILNVYNETQGMDMRQRPLSWVRSKKLANPSSTGTPMDYAFNGLDSSGNTKICLWDVPDGVYSINVFGVSPQADLTDGTTIVKAPSAPIIHLALAMLARERGETGGTSTAEYFQMADKYLRDAVALEAARHEDELIYFTV
jgi:hypothetical protein